MFWPTHACLPVALGLGISAWRRQRSAVPALTWHAYALIALAAILPDLLTPHRFLEERLQSWSHTAWFIPLAAVCFLPVARRPGLGGWTTWLLMDAAVASHLALDAVSGGIPLLLPFSAAPVGDRWIPYATWLIWDAVSVVAVALLAYAVHRPERGRVAAQPS